jgi:hypothetical protein
MTVAGLGSTPSTTPHKVGCGAVVTAHYVMLCTTPSLHFFFPLGLGSVCQDHTLMMAVFFLLALTDKIH